MEENERNQQEWDFACEGVAPPGKAGKLDKDGLGDERC